MLDWAEKPKVVMLQFNSGAGIHLKATSFFFHPRFIMHIGLFCFMIFRLLGGHEM